MSGRATSRSEVSGEISLATGEGMRRPLKKSDAHDDLADLGVGLHESEGGRQLVEGEDLVDQGAEGTVLQLRHDVADEAAQVSLRWAALRSRLLTPNTVRRLPCSASRSSVALIVRPC